tara:strand:- start:616 stop:795 length:180 start_codon:yes stop_codon:yes gene_type:complete
MPDKISYNKKMIGKFVTVKQDTYEWKGIIKSVVDEYTFKIQDSKTQEVCSVDLFEIEFD